MRARAEENTESGQEDEEEIEHEPIVVTSCREPTKQTASCWEDGSQAFGYTHSLSRSPTIEELHDS